MDNLVCVKTDMKKVEMQRAPVATPGPGQALVKMRLSTICGSDIHLVDELPIPAGTPMGHEAVGEIVDAGEGVTSFKQGDRVIASLQVHGGPCLPSRQGFAPEGQTATPSLSATSADAGYAR